MPGHLLLYASALNDDDTKKMTEENSSSGDFQPLRLLSLHVGIKYYFRKKETGMKVRSTGVPKKNCLFGGDR